MTILVGRLVADELWALVEPLPPAPPRPPYGGRRCTISDRSCFARDRVHGHTSTPWRLLPRPRARLRFVGDLLAVPDRVGRGWGVRSTSSRGPGSAGRAWGTRWAQIRSIVASLVQAPPGLRRWRPAADRQPGRAASAWDQAAGRRAWGSSPRPGLGVTAGRTSGVLAWLSCWRRLGVRRDRDSGRWFAFVLVPARSSASTGSYRQGSDRTSWVNAY
jgi:hypothetical protein